MRRIELDGAENQFVSKSDPLFASSKTLLLPVSWNEWDPLIVLTLVSVSRFLLCAFCLVYDPDLGDYGPRSRSGSQLWMPLCATTSSHILAMQTEFSVWFLAKTSTYSHH